MAPESPEPSAPADMALRPAADLVRPAADVGPIVNARAAIGRKATAAAARRHGLGILILVRCVRGGICGIADGEGSSEAKIEYIYIYSRGVDTSSS